MNVNRNKKTKAVLNNSSKQRRSSLQVNLSCASNLTDSGNESLKQTDIEYRDNTCLGNASRCSNGKQTFANHRSTSCGNPLKDASVILERISHDDAVLNKYCEKLKYAILHKTNQIFDKQNELSVKTCTILNAETDQLSTTVYKSVAIEDKDVSVMPDNGNEIELKDRGANLIENVNSTPKDKYKHLSMKEQRKQNILRKRRLFVAKEQSNDIVSSPYVSNTSAHEDTFTGTPIAYSTMIDGHNKICGPEDEVYFQPKNNLSSVSNMHAKNNVTSMEITDICGGFILCDKPQSSVKCVEKIASNKYTSASIEQTLLQTNANNEELLHETSKKFRTVTTINKDTEKNISMQRNNSSIETHSANTVQTSLNVNTSIDLVNQSNRSIDKCTQTHEEETCKNFKSRYKEGMQVAVLEEVQGSINTVCTSLQMNTSLNSLCTLRENPRGSTEENSAGTVSRDKTEDTDLTKKHKEKSKINSTTINNQPRLILHKIHSNEPSYIEPTPYPMSRSIMLRSQLKQNANDLHLKVKSSLLEQDTPVASINLCKSLQEVKNDTVTLDDSSREKSNVKSQTSVAIDKVVNENKLEEDTNIKRIDKKRCRKKLMPLHECSQFSISPIEKHHSPSPRLTYRRKVKKKNKCNKVNVSNVPCNEREVKKNYNEEKSQRKRRRIVSKKIVVKKIVNQDILRKLEESRENLNKTRVDVNGSNGNSSVDFQSLKRLSTTQSSRKKGRRIIIVTTGLSNEDKSIVKSVVKALGSAKIEPSVTKHTTHVVTTGVRTINLLHGIIRGCWLVSLEWVLTSLENNAWLSPEKYEMTHFSKAVLENRKDRQLFGSSYVPELFAACGYIYIEKNTTPPCEVLKDLVKVAGGCITENPEVAKVLVGKEGLKESWVLDCITSGELQSYDPYRRR